VGIGVPPYKLNVVQTGKCSGHGAVDRVLKNQPKAELLTKRNIAFLAPNSEMDLESIVLCNEAKTSFQLAYEPVFTLPTPEATAKIDAYIKARNMNPEAIRPLLPDDVKFLAGTGFLPENANLSSGGNDEPPSLQRYVESVKLIGSATKLIIMSNTVHYSN
jgi:hypothetical protein